MREIRVSIDAATGKITVWNDGPGIEPVMHKSGKGLIPEVAFGEFMASTNFDDNTRQRFTGGRFGVGAKATNAWSKEFTVKTFHAKSGVEYEQTWTDNMLHKTKPKVAMINLYVDLNVIEIQLVNHEPAKKGWTCISWIPVSSSATLEARGIVNGVLCSQGTHIEHLVTKISDGLVQRAIKQQKRDKLKLDDSKTGLAKMKNYFRQHMAIIGLVQFFRFSQTLILGCNGFDQTKEKLTLNPKEWGFPATIDEKLVERIDRHLGLVDKVLMEAEARNLAALSKKAGGAPGASARVSIAKYQEGDSAKDLAVAGMEIVGRDCYGVIPLRGVIRNVRPAKVNAKVLKDFLKNAELAAINKVLGLQFGVEYTPENVHRLLRYDHFVIFCDQDPDGAHIAGELINYFTIMFPSLLKAKPDFLMRLGTPIIRLKSRSGMTDHELKSKYKNLDDHLVPILYKDQEDDEVVDKWFRKNRADARKVMYTAIKRKFKDPIKVVQFAGAVLETAAYHHGDAALQGAIIAMARRFCGSNNINLLHPDGQFGSRHSNHAGAARYISAGLEKITRSIFRPEDDPILVVKLHCDYSSMRRLCQEYQNEDGQVIEPKYFLPVVPMALINGCEAGIAVGWSSFVPMYNPRDVLNWLRERLKQCRDQDASGYTIDASIPGVLDAALSQTREETDTLEKMNDNEGQADAVEARADDVSVEEDGEENQMTDTDIPSTSSKITSSVRAAMKNDGYTDVLVPWYDGFDGEIFRTGPHSYKLRGKAEYFEPLKKGAHGTVVVTEVSYPDPSRLWLISVQVGPTVRSDALREAWKERWGPAEVKDAKRKKASEGHQFLKDEQIHNTATKVHIELFVDPQKIRAAAGVSNPKKHLTLEKLEKILGISESGANQFSTTNMHLFDAGMTMRRGYPGAFLSPSSHRLRETKGLSGPSAKFPMFILTARVQARYCTMVHDGELSIVKKTVAQREKDLADANFTKLLPKSKRDAAEDDENREGDDDKGGRRRNLYWLPANNSTKETALPSYDYLLRVPTLSCTTEHAKKLREEAKRLEGQLQELMKTDLITMWEKDLNEFEEALNDFSSRKYDALNKNIKNRPQPPKRRHKKEIMAERRIQMKEEREDAEKKKKLTHSQKTMIHMQEKQEKDRMVSSKSLVLGVKQHHKSLQGRTSF
ncbi:hypothetical protein GUITHDRAFT_139486 [Guillardia theta CCMP2712]|uniref:DNA topoisomerase (ATP-hydrolyzing) n=1 Tax=Guillardia theta (strain CCMP2712) TaxID=905079 RepID=L1J9U8_GUITC|nr:hypothetical protein GUITHDRAFT_139486 [Guillardia theta CCMP2712]EKX44879.1 hypothetical protein GUITHDRAFT_139486 [Guillardia theta CCMP2712]|eukprot:XP_005831859.1 hypothetical protein GUITHDRAFT_139486 [Guillardia theta CCMP2712]